MFTSLPTHLPMEITTLILSYCDNDQSLLNLALMNRFNAHLLFGWKECKEDIVNSIMVDEFRTTIWKEKIQYLINKYIVRVMKESNYNESHNHIQHCLGSISNIDEYMEKNCGMIDGVDSKEYHMVVYRKMKGMKLISMEHGENIQRGKTYTVPADCSFKYYTVYGSIPLSSKITNEEFTLRGYEIQIHQDNGSIYLGIANWNESTAGGSFSETIKENRGITLMAGGPLSKSFDDTTFSEYEDSYEPVKIGRRFSVVLENYRINFYEEGRFVTCLNFENRLAPDFPFIACSPGTSFTLYPLLQIYKEQK